MPINEQQMAQAIYDTLFSAFTNPPNGFNNPDPGSKDTTTYLTLNWPGQQLDFTQFANPWSPNNTGGSTFAAENFATLVDPVFSTFPIATPNAQKVSQIFKLVANSKVVPEQESPADKATYDKAFNFLHADGTSYDDDGKAITIKVDSPVYANYKRKLVAYNTALATMMSNYFQYDMTKPDDQRKWSMLGPTFQSSVQMAWDDLQNAQATRVQDALATLAQSSNNQVGTLFKDARQQFEMMKRSSVSGGGDWWPTNAIPANWFAPNAATEWTAVTINSGSLRTSEHSDFSQTTAGGRASWGLWSFGGGFGHESSNQFMSNETQSLSVSFKFARVTIDRPWYNNLLFSVKGWKTAAYDAGMISNGTKSQDKLPFPMLSTSFIVVRDVKISASWSKEESSMISSKISGSASAGWGPFAISGSYSHASTDKNFASSFDGKTITNNGLQIIGWVNTIIPSCPPPLSAADAAAIAKVNVDVTSKQQA